MHCFQLYLRARFYRPVLSSLVVPTIQFFLFFGASFVGYSRISDYKHHWSDVLVGSIAGTTIGFITAVFIAEVFKKQEIPHAHKSTSEFGLVSLVSFTHLYILMIIKLSGSIQQTS